MFESADHVLSALASVGYLTDRITATTVYLAAKLHKPLLLEGPAGGGKTELAYAVTRACHCAIESLPCFEGITAKEAIGDFDEALRKLYLESLPRTADLDPIELARALNRLEFYLPGPLLKSLLSEKPCVLLVDELDKVSRSFEAVLLEILSRWQISEPRLGLITAKSIPFAVLTSNAERPLGHAIRRRSMYLRVEYPTPQLEGEIVARRTPGASPYTHRLIAGFAKAARAYRLEKPPSISEMIDMALAIELLGLADVTDEHRDILLPLFAKTERDRKKLADLKDAFSTILYAAKLYAQDNEHRDAQDLFEQVAEEQAI